MPSLTPSVITTLLPTTEPVFRIPEGVRPDLPVSQGGQVLSPLEGRIFRWLSTLQARIEEERWDHQLPGFAGATYGFVPVSGAADPPSAVKASGGYVFGVAIEIEPASGEPIQQIELFYENDVAIARVLNRRTIEPHYPNPSVPHGTGACWARSKKSKIHPAADGVLTAEHVITGLSLGSAVAMSAPGSWNLGDRGSCKIDAALIVQSGCIPSSAVSLGVQTSPLPSRSVTFVGAASPGPVTANITHTLVHPTYLSDRHPMRVFMDAYGIAGDSGALVQESRSSLGVGIYMGRDPIPPSLGSPPVYEGVAQHLSQAQYTLQVDLFV